MPRGRPRKYQGPLRPGERSAGVKGLNRKETTQVKRIAKQQVRLRSETKRRAWLYPKTTYSELLHNKPKFLFGGPIPANGLLNLSKGDDSIVHPNGASLPQNSPGACREGQQVRLQALTHSCILSGDGANKNVMLRMIMFSYPTTQTSSVSESDILLQPFGTGVGQGWPNIFLRKNTYNNKGIRFLLDRTYQLKGQTSGAMALEVEGVPAPNWGLSGVKTFQFSKFFKGGRRIKYVEHPSGEDSSLPAVDNYGIMVIPYGSGVTDQDEPCGRIEILGDMLFKDL